MLPHPVRYKKDVGLRYANPTYETPPSMEEGKGGEGLLSLG